VTRNRPWLGGAGPGWRGRCQPAGRSRPAGKGLHVPAQSWRTSPLSGASKITHRTGRRTRLRIRRPRHRSPAVFGPIVGHDPLAPIGLSASAGSASGRRGVVVEVIDRRAVSPQFLGTRHGASVAGTANPQNGRSLRRATLQLRALLALRWERHRSRQASDRLAAKGLGRGMPVKAVSRRSRARAARALTCFRRSSSVRPRFGSARRARCQQSYLFKPLQKIAGSCARTHIAPGI
jgi:hypothetical protein